MSLRMFIGQNKKVNTLKGTYFEEYGGLYNRDCLSGIAANGWRIPESRDLLRNYLGDVGNELRSKRTEIGDPEVGTPTNEHPRWDYHNSAYGTDIYNFNALPSSQREEDGVFGGSFTDIGIMFAIHTTEAGSGTLYSAMNLFFDTMSIGRTNFDEKNRAYAIRVIRDATANEKDSEHVDFIAEGTVQTEMYTGHDDKKYDGVRIGDHFWITENLKETKREVGEVLVDIPVVTSNAAWAALDGAAMCAFPQ